MSENIITTSVDMKDNAPTPTFSNIQNSELPTQGYVERLHSTVEKFSKESITLNPQIWQEGTVDGKSSWDKLEDWFTAIEFKDTPENVNLPYWGIVDIPTLEQLNDLDGEKIGTKDVLSRLFLLSSVLNVDIDYLDKQRGYQKDSMKFGDLISDVYPGLEKGIKDIQKYLQLSVEDPDKFESMFGIKEDSDISLRQLFAKGGIALVSTSTTLMLLLASCSPMQAQEVKEPVAIEQTLEQEDVVVTPSYTATQSPTSTPTQTPTETQEPTPTETPTRIPTSDDYWVRGYSVGIEIFPGEGVSNTLFIEEAVIDNYHLEEDEIVLDIDMLIYERRIKESVRAKSFRFVEYSFDTKSFSSPIIITVENFAELEELLSDIGQKTLFQVEVIVEDLPEFSDDFVVDYVSGYVDPDFNIIKIVKYKDTRR